LQSNIVSPFAAHQQQMAFLAQHQQALLMASSKSGGALQNMTGKIQNTGSIDVQSSGGEIATDNFNFLASAIPEIRPSLAVNNEQNKPIQVGNNNQVYSPVNYNYFSTSSVYATGPTVPVNGISASGGGDFSLSPTVSVNATSSNGLVQSSSPTPPSYIAPSKSGSDYDFSSLTQGFFTKQ